MNTNENINSNIPTSQTTLPDQDKLWQLIYQGGSYQTTDNYEDPSGHLIVVRVTEYELYSHVQIEVHYENAFVEACSVHFSGISHANLSSDFVEQYLESDELKSVCKYFDELCIEFYDEDEDVDVA